MKQLGAIALLMAGGLLAWALLAKLSADAVALAIGLLGGALAVLPMAGLLAAAERRGRHPMTLDAWPDDAPDAWPDDDPPALTVNHYHLHLHGDVTPATLARFPGERPAALIATRRDL